MPKITVYVDDFTDYVLNDMAFANNSTPGKMIEKVLLTTLNTLPYADRRLILDRWRVLRRMTIMHSRASRMAERKRKAGATKPAVD